MLLDAQMRKGGHICLDPLLPLPISSSAMPWPPHIQPAWKKHIHGVKAFHIGNNKFHTSSVARCGCETRAARKTIFSGIQPTGTIHLGNYFGAVRRWIELQESGEDVIYSIVDLHSITLPQDPKTLHSNIIMMAASLIACGIDPNQAILFQQSRVSEHAQFNWVLGCITTMARLNHLPQYKEKSSMLKEIPLGLYVYPVLQAADILLYRATHVPVGDDQRQHIQLAAHLARVFNNKFGHTFTLPRSLVYDDTTARVRSLRQPARKMSKSEMDPKSRINLTDSPDCIREKFKKAVTDFTSAVYYDAENRPGVSNLIAIHSSITGKSFDDIRTDCENMTTAQYKLLVADVVIDHFSPIRQRIEQLLKESGHLNQLLDQGADRAKSIAARTWEEVKQKVGLSEN